MKLIPGPLLNILRFTPSARLDTLIVVLDRSRKRLAVALGIAIILHLPFTPAMPILRLLHRITGHKQLQQENRAPAKPREVEVELREAAKSDQLRQETPQVPPTGPSITVGAPSNIKFAKNADSKKSDPDKPKDKQEKAKVKDVGLEGKLENRINLKPNVTLGLWFTSMRDHPLGKRLTDLASCDAEWKAFTRQGVNLLQDFEGVLVVGPNLMEPSQMTAAVRHTLSGEKVHDIMDKLVRESGAKGRWLSPNVASAHVGKTQRVLLPQHSEMFFIAPTKGWEALANVKEPLRVPSAEGRVASLVLVHPNKLLERIGLTLPKRVSEMRLEVFANPDASIDLKVELEDSSEQTAKQDARRVSEQFHDLFADLWVTAAAVRTLAGSNIGDAQPAENAPRLDLSAQERTLTGMVHMSPAQAGATLDLLQSFMCRKKSHGHVAKASMP